MPFIDTVKLAASDALATSKAILKDPIGAPKSEYDRVGEKRSLALGIFLGVVFDLLVVLGVYLAAKPFLQIMSGEGSYGGRGGGVSFSIIIKLVIVALLPVGSLAVGSLVTRKIFGKAGGIGGDMLTAGVALLPVGLVVLAFGILGMGNMEVSIALSVFAATTMILVLYGGSTRIATMSDQASCLVIPIWLLVAAYFTKIVLAAMVR